jgi:hypothetical protein
MQQRCFWKYQLHITVTYLFDGDACHVHLSKERDEVAFDDLYVVLEDARACTPRYFVSHLGDAGFGNVLKAFNYGWQPSPLPKPCLVVPIAGNTHSVIKVAFTGAEPYPLAGVQMETSLPIGTARYLEHHHLAISQVMQPIFGWFKRLGCCWRLSACRSPRNGFSVV